jgi:8-oxo-dGTP pyrophosphatase MutT (NUDIX family)
MSSPSHSRNNDPVPARPAATVIVVRPGASTGDLEFLMLARSRHSRFAPGFVVFPGGVAEPGDQDLSRAWFGRTDEESVARACALRELAEETGLVVTREGLRRSSVGGRPEAFIPPTTHQVPEVARWIAPEFLPVRFDARFFALACREAIEPVADGREAVAAWWSSAGAVLEGFREGRVQLMWPTLKMLEALAGCASVEDVLRLRVEQVERPASRG